MSPAPAAGAEWLPPAVASWLSAGRLWARRRPAAAARMVVPLFMAPSPSWLRAGRKGVATGIVVGGICQTPVRRAGFRFADPQNFGQSEVSSMDASYPRDMKGYGRNPP